jgi:hypothetical protein
VLSSLCLLILADSTNLDQGAGSWLIPTGGSISAVGALGFIAWHLLTRTVPKLTDAFSSAIEKQNAAHQQCVKDHQEHCQSEFALQRQDFKTALAEQRRDLIAQMNRMSKSDKD